MIKTYREVECQFVDEKGKKCGKVFQANRRTRKYCPKCQPEAQYQTHKRFMAELSPEKKAFYERNLEKHKQTAKTKRLLNSVKTVVE